MTPNLTRLAEIEARVEAAAKDLQVHTCVDCGKPFDPRESLMGDEGQCQLCWEAQCDRSWWEYMRRLDEALGPVKC